MLSQLIDRLIETVAAGEDGTRIGCFIMQDSTTRERLAAKSIARKTLRAALRVGTPKSGVESFDVFRSFLGQKL